MAAVVEKAKAEDPRELRRQLADLKGQLAQAVAGKPPAGWPPGAAGWPGGKFKLQPAKIVQVDPRGEKAVTQARHDVRQIMDSVRTLAERTGEAVERMGQLAQALGKVWESLERSPEAREAVAHAETVIGRFREDFVPSRSAQRRLAVQAGGGVTLSRMARAILTALAQHPEGLTKAQILTHASYASSGPVSACFAHLGASGWIDVERAGLVLITREGLTALGPYEPLPTGSALRDYVLAQKLSRMEGALLKVLLKAYPDEVAKGAILEKAEYAASGPVSAAFAKLVRLNYAVAGRVGLRAAEEFFE